MIRGNVRTQALQELAHRLLEEWGIDAATQSVLPNRALVKAFMVAGGCSIPTAKRHLAAAARRMRGETGNVARGGTRRGSGRPPKEETMTRKPEFYAVSALNERDSWTIFSGPCASRAEAWAQGEDRVGRDSSAETKTYRVNLRSVSKTEMAATPYRIRTAEEIVGHYYISPAEMYEGGS